MNPNEWPTATFPLQPGFSASRYHDQEDAPLAFFFLRGEEGCVQAFIAPFDDNLTDLYFHSPRPLTGVHLASCDALGQPAYCDGQMNNPQIREAYDAGLMREFLTAQYRWFFLEWNRNDRA